MELLEVIKSKEVDIYISVATTILGLILGLIIDFIRNSRTRNSPTSNASANSITVNNVINPQMMHQVNIVESNKSNAVSSSNDEGVPFLLAIVLFIVGVIYLFNRVEILNSLYYLTIFIVSVWSGGVLHSLINGRLVGGKWIANLFFYGCFFFASFNVLNKTLAPNFAPKNFTYSQEIISRHGILGLGDYFDMADFMWFTFHIIGVVFLLFAMIRLSLSAIYFFVMGNYVASNGIQEPSIARLTRKYAYFGENIIVISLLLFASYFLVAGNFFMWFSHEFPVVMELFINKLLHGG